MTSHSFFRRFTSSFSKINVRDELRTFGILVSWLPGAICFVNYVGHLNSVSGPSMYPTFNPDENRGKEDYVILSKILPWRNLKPGQVVIFRSPLNPEKLAVKRIIATQGQTIRTKRPYPHSHVTIPTNHIWVEGDGDSHNENSSLDSNHYGAISAGLIDAKVKYIVWPPSRIQKVEEEVPKRKLERIVKDDGRSMAEKLLEEMG